VVECRAMNERTSNRYARWLPAILVMGIIFALSSLPAYRIPFFGRYDLLIKKGAHALGYGLLGLAYAYALPSRLSLPVRWGLSLCMAVLFALSDEFHQSFVEGRSSSLTDVFIDSVGAAFALTVGIGYSSNSNSKSDS
jgi:VanZ family protein